MTPTEQLNALAEQFERFREEDGLTYDAIAKRAAMHKPNVIWVAKMTREPTLHTMAKACRGLGRPLSQLLDPKGKGHRKTPMAADAQVERFQANITALKERRNLTWTEIAEQSGIGETHIRRIVRGARRPSMELVFVLASSLDVEPVELVR